jgi:hypothetical protein
MSNVYHDAIQGMTADIEALDQRRALLARALEGLQLLAGESVATPPRKYARRNGRIAKKPRALTRNERTNERTKQGAGHVRPQSGASLTMLRLN